MNAYELANELAFKTIDGDPNGALLSLVIDRLRIQADSIVGLKLSWQAVQDENQRLKKYFEAWKLLNNGMIELGSNARKIIEDYE